MFSVGPAERSLEVVFHTGGCGSRNNHSTLQETKTTISVSLLREVPTGELICPDIYVIGRIRVELAAPLAGRVIVGPPASVPFGGGGPLWAVTGQAETSVGLAPLAPRLVGFAPVDAKDALKLLGLKATIDLVRRGRGLSRVVGQSPAPGRVVPRDKPVVLRVIEP